MTLRTGRAARRDCKKVRVEIKEVYLTSGSDDLLVIVDTPNDDGRRQVRTRVGSQGNLSPNRPRLACPNFKS